MRCPCFGYRAWKMDNFQKIDTRAALVAVLFLQEFIPGATS